MHHVPEAFATPSAAAQKDLDAEGHIPRTRPLDDIQKELPAARVRATKSTAELSKVRAELLQYEEDHKPGNPHKARFRSPLWTPPVYRIGEAEEKAAAAKAALTALLTEEQQTIAVLKQFESVPIAETGPIAVDPGHYHAPPQVLPPNFMPQEPPLTQAQRTAKAVQESLGQQFVHEQGSHKLPDLSITLAPGHDLASRSTFVPTLGEGRYEPRIKKPAQSGVDAERVLEERQERSARASE